MQLTDRCQEFYINNLEVGSENNFSKEKLYFRKEHAED